MKRTMTVLLIVLMLICCTNTAFAATTPNPGDTLSINTDAVEITQAGTYTITGSGETTNIITVKPNITGEVNITLSDVNINVSAITNACAFTMGSGTTVNLTLTGTNVLKSGLSRAGLNVPVGAVLNIDGTGSLEAAGRGDINKGGAGIGGNAGSSAGTISINGGTVTATGGTLGAGIGGGNSGTGGNISISAGTVTATSGLDAAGIGGGDSASAGQITITGGSVTALSTRDGAGIGGGWNGNGGVVTISGGIVSATSNEDGAGIGSGNGSSYTCTGGTVIIEGSAVVTARGGERGAGIGGGNNGNGGNITISGGTVTAIGEKSGAGIGSGYGLDLSGGNITISGGTVTATGGEDGAGIGGGIGGKGGNIKISGGIVIANAGSQGAGIGGGLLGIGGSIDIYGGETYATGGSARPVSSINKPGHDIGDGGGASSTEHTRFRLSGITAVFMRNDTSVAVTHRDFKHKELSVNGFKSDYEYDHFPASWGNEYVYGYIYDTVYYYVDFAPQNGSSIDAQAVNQGGKATKPNDLLKNGFVFAGWFTGASCNDADKWDFDTDTIEKPTTLYAKWIPAYTVAFNSLGGSPVNSQTIGEGSKATKPADPVKGDKRFGGWYTSSDCKDDELWDFDANTVSADITLYAKWTDIPTYTVTFDSGSGSAVSSQTVTEGEKAAKPSDPTLSGYIFGGWYTSDTFNDDDRWNFTACTVAKDMTLYAKWTAIPVTPAYTVAFDSGGGSAVASQTVNEGDKAIKPNNPTRTGYSFGGWYTSSGCNDDDRWNFDICKVDKDMTLYAKWTAIPIAPTYTVSFDSQSGSVVDNQTVNEGDKAAMPSDPTRSGYTFGGWYTSTKCDDDNRWNFDICKVDKDMTLYAKWTATPVTPTYIVSFNSQSDSRVDSQTVNQGGKATMPSDPTRSGFTFGGWYTSTKCNDDDRWNFVYCTVSKDITLYAKWTAVSQETAYTVTFDAKGGSGTSSKTTGEGKTVSKPNDPARSGYTFGGWYTSTNCGDDNRWNFEHCTVSKDITLYAKWTAVSQETAYTVTFDAGGGSSVSSKSTDNGKTVSKPVDPARGGYEFGGWYTSSTCHDCDRWNFEYCTVSKDITLYAKWTNISAEAEQSETQVPEETSEPKTSPKATITPTVIKENKKTGTTTMEIDINDLPEGTRKIKLPSGDTTVVKGSSGTVKLEINSKDITKDGTMKIVALNNEGTPLSSHNIQVRDENGQTIVINADKGWTAVSSVLIWVLICVVGLSAAVFVTYVIFKKKKA